MTTPPEWITAAATNLRLPSSTLDEATAMFRIAARSARAEADDAWTWTIGAACLFLATKSDEQPRKLHDVVVVAHAARFGESFADADAYRACKERVLCAERDVVVAYFNSDFVRGL